MKTNEVRHDIKDSYIAVWETTGCQLYTRWSGEQEHENAYHNNWLQL